MELRRRLGETLDQAAAGERIVVERDRRPLAVIVPYSASALRSETAEERREHLRRALDQLEDFGKRMRRKYPGGPSAAEAVRWDRDHGHGDHG